MAAKERGPLESRRFGRARTADKEGAKGLEKRARGASAPMDMSAYLDALGLPTKKIASVIGVHEKTVSHWRGTQDYMERVAFWREREIGELEPLLHKLKIDAMDMIDVAVATLKDVMKNAVHADGRPNYALRASAAREAFNSSLARVTIGADSVAAGTTINASQQTMTLVFTNEAQPAPAAEDIIDSDIRDADIVPLAELGPVAIELESDTGGEAEAPEDPVSS